jgi:hypothetical protein
MYGYRTHSITITDAQEIIPQNKIISYNFRNYGSTIALISRVNAPSNDTPIQLESGEAWDTRLEGGMDQTRYKISFKSINDQDPNGQQSELLITFFAAI